MKFNGTIIITDPCYIIKDEDWDRCDYGDNVKCLGFENCICEDTIYGDWTCFTYKGSEPNAEIIRSRGKITAAVNNAKIFMEIQKEFGSFSNYIWAFTDNKIIKNTTDEFPVKTELSDRISKDLKKRGMKYTGSVIIYSYLQAIGVVNDHEINCFKY